MTSDDTIVQEAGFGFTPRDNEVVSNRRSFQIVRRYTMTNKNNGSVQLISWGAGIQSIRVPNSGGILGDVVLGFDDMKGYLGTRHIGRIVNSLDNSGNKVFDNLDQVNWESYKSGKQVIMSYTNGVADKQCLAKILIHVKFNWTESHELDINIRATVTKTTLMNITFHCPMNLAGHGMGSEELKNHVVTINSDKFIASCCDENCSNMIDKVDGTLYDFRKPTRLKNRLEMNPRGGYDDDLSINSPSERCYRFHARIFHPGSGRFVEIYSNQAILRLSTGNEFPDPVQALPILQDDYVWQGCGDGPTNKSNVIDENTNERIEIRGKDGVLYRRHCAFVLSPQNYTNDASFFPNCVLRPGEIFSHVISYKFGAKSKNN